MKTYHHLLLAVDFHEDNHALMKDAQALAKQYQAKLSVVHVLPHLLSSIPYAYDFQESLTDSTQTFADSFITEFGLQPEQLYLRQGHPKVEITQLADEIQADLIVCGSHGKHGLDLILGSTANGILHLAKQDVLTLRLDRTGQRLRDFPYRTILFATDLYPDSERVAQLALACSQEWNATLHIIHAVGDIAALGYYPVIEIDLKNEAIKHLNSFIDKMKLAIPPERAHTSIGFPKQEILDLASHIQADLIILGSHGRKALASAVLGSTANSVLHGAQCDVLVARL